MFEEFVIGPVVEATLTFSSKNAFRIHDQFYTYQQFAECISKIRGALKTFETKSDNVGLVANDDLETYASIFALWLEGKAYVPLHPSQPFDRIMEITEQADVDLIVDSGSMFRFEIEVIRSSDLKFQSLDLTAKKINDNALAYILFTSGSTGKPKGVPITRGNIGSFMKSFWETDISISSHDRCLQCFDLTFDVSIQSFLAPLTRGACVYTIPHDQIKYSYVYSLFEEHQLTFGAMAPSMIRYLRPYFSEISLPNVRVIILTAEASPIELIRQWCFCVPNAEIFNFYGPTEATIYCSYYRYDKNHPKELNGLLSIGKPMNGIQAFVLDENNEEVSDSTKGQLCIAGDQLTLGYWKNDIKNREAFFDKAVNGRTVRFYKTGDLCFRDSNGDIMYSGRLDHQVKIQGYRIELGEIEYHAREFLKGKNAIGVAYLNEIGNSEIALFVEAEPESSELIRYLATKLPAYMIPSKIIFKNEFPLNSNGKIDRNVLKQTLQHKAHG